MAIETDIFTGKEVLVAVSTDLAEIPTFHATTFVNAENVASFPTIGTTRSIQEVETFDSEFTSRMAGNLTLDNTEITFNKVIDDPVQELLSSCILSKQELRFRNFYVIDTVQSSAKTGFFQIFDAMVTAENITGGGDTPVMVTYRLAPTAMKLSGVTKTGELLYTGDYGIGAGTADYPGLQDYDRLSGNRFLQLPATTTHNPFGIDTAVLAMQGSENNGWQLAVNSTGEMPIIRVRTVDASGKVSEWVKVYSEIERPSANDIRALDLNGTNAMTGALRTPDVQTGNLRFVEPLNGANDVTKIRKIQTTDAQGQPVDLASFQSVSNRVVFKTPIVDGTTEVREGGIRVYSPNNKPTPGYLGAVAVNGDTMTGTLAVKDKLTVYVQNGTQPEIVTTRADHPDAGDLKYRTFKILPGKNGETLFRYFDPAGNTTSTTTINNTGGVLYSTNNRPSAADIKAVDINDVIDLGTF